MVVDIGAVRLVIVAADLRAQLLKDHGRYLEAGPLRAVQHHVQAVQTHIRGLLDEVHIAPGGVALPHGTAHPLAGGRLKVCRHPVADDLLDLVLHRVGQLVAVFIKELDAVIFHRVVAGADDRACVRLVEPGQIGDGRGRQHLHQHRPRAHAANARHQRAFQHLPADAGVPSHQDRGPVDVAGQHISAGLSQPKG